SDLADELPGGRTVPRRSAWPDAVRPLSHGAACPDEPPTRQINPQCVAQRVDANRSRRTDRWRACASPAGQKREAWCMIQVRDHGVPALATGDNKSGLLPIVWVKTGQFSRVDSDSKGFLVNLTVTS